MTPNTFTAKTIFVVEEAKTGASSLGGLAAIAGSFGVDLNSASGGSILAGDNILIYFKSPSLIKEVLLSESTIKKGNCLADDFVSVYELGKQFKLESTIGKVSLSNFKLSDPKIRQRDSLMNIIINGFVLENNLSINRVDKKATFIEVAYTLKNEILAKTFCERLVSIAISKYVNSKTKRQQSTVDKLQFRVDSILGLLNNKTLGSALLQSQASTMDLNPLYKINSTVKSEITNRDKLMLSTIFTEVVKNLELAKFNLSQETPVIQIIDNPDIPLKINRISKRKTLVIFCLGGFFFSIIALLGVKVISDEFV